MIVEYLNRQGLTVAVEMLKSLCMTKGDGEAIYNALSILAESVVFPPFSITIPSTGWKNGKVGDYNIYLDVSAEVGANDSVFVTLSADGISTAGDCGLCPTAETLDGAIRFRAVSTPTGSMSGEVRVLRGE